MDILNEIRKKPISTNWFMMDKCWYCFSDGQLYTQDKTKTGEESIIKINDEKTFEQVFKYYKSK